MSKIVVGVDASEESREALDWARMQAGPDDQIVAVHAWDIPLVAGYEMAIAIDPGEIEQGASSFLDRVVGDLSDGRVVAHLAQGHPGRSLVAVAEGDADHPGIVDGPADMVVVGHRGTGKASVILGSTANYVMHHTERPVVVIRGMYSGAPRLVAVGVDDHRVEEGENASVRALRFAYGLRGVEEIAVIHAWFAPGVAAGLYAGAGADMEKMDAEAIAVVEHVMELAGPPPEGVSVRAVAERGTAGFALVEASNEADLVVLGSRGRGGFLGLILGSTSLEVAAHAHAPVAIVR
ncbi:MAG: universal stress protein [Ilumatobacter sp.]|nr:MAG: universal stress protein [Ilumatobacter sp.]